MLLIGDDNAKNVTINNKSVENESLSSITFTYRIDPRHDPEDRGWPFSGGSRVKYHYGNYYVYIKPFYQYYLYRLRSQGEVDARGNHICTKDAYMHWEVKFKYVGE